MSSRLPRYVLAVVAAGLAGLVANALIMWMIADGAFFTQITDPARIALAILVAGLLPPIHIRFPFIIEDLISLVTLTLIPSLLARYAFGIDAPWSELIAFHAVYAAAALMTYRFVAEWGREVND